MKSHYNYNEDKGWIKKEEKKNAKKFKKKVALLGKSHYNKDVKKGRYKKNENESIVFG